jgi:predicted CXXCH cytochrome family protein
VLASRLSSDNQIRTCGRCHKDMTDGYLASDHAHALLVSGLVSAPSCTDCHGGHSIHGAENKRSTVAHGKVPKTCGECHAGVLRTWETDSAHGMAWANDDEEAPVCSNCHDSHAASTVRGLARLDTPEECGTCHEERYTSYQGSFHGQATNLGFEPSATCSDCHTAHANLPASDSRSSVHPDNLDETCGACHGEVNEAFLTFDPHSVPSDPGGNQYVYWIFIFMTSLLLGVFGFFALHDSLWLQRSFVAVLRGEVHARPAGQGPHIRRFNNRQILTHVTIVITFLLLAATGLPLKFHTEPWAPAVIDAFGGLGVARWLHRVAAVATFGYAAYHLLDVLWNSFRKHGLKIFWGPDSMVPQPQDAKDLIGNFKWFFYAGPRPEGGRWTYCEKFDYMAVFWGIPIIGISGLMLWYPGFFTSFLPGWTLNAAHLVHSDEALLATGFIFVFHFFHTHLRPESFPMDPVIFTGRMPLERFKEERGLEYQQLVESGELESRLVDAPTPGEMRRAYVFGMTALTVGVALAVGIFYSLINLLAGH